MYRVPADAQPRPVAALAPDIPPVAALAPDIPVSVSLPCRTEPDDLWFSDSPSELEQAKVLCATCPIRRACLAGALERREFAGVWGGEILDRGAVIARKRPRGRPSKADLARDAEIAAARAAAGVA